MFQQPVAIITGASRGMGAATALWLAGIGAGVTLAARNETELQRIADGVEQRGGVALPVRTDISDPKACLRVVEQTLKRFGRLDALINNAGLLDPIAIASEADPDRWEANLAVNLLGPFYLSGAAIPALRRSHGRIVNISSGAAYRAVPGWSAYCAAKAGLTHFTRVLALEEPDIVALSLRPGVVDTAMQERIRTEGPGRMTPDRVAYFEGLKRDGQLEPPEVPAKSTAWLALHAPPEWSGRLIEYDDPEVVAGAAKVFGERKEMP